MKKLLETIFSFQNTVLDYGTLCDRFSESDLKLLQDIGVIKKTRWESEVLCPNCNSHFVELKQKDDNSLYYVCTDPYEGCITDITDPKVFHRYGIDIMSLLQLIKEEIDIRQSLETRAEGHIWSLGTYTTERGHIPVFVQYHSDAKKNIPISDNTTTQNIIVLSIGENSHYVAGSTNKVFPLGDILAIARKKLKVKKDIFEEYANNFGKQVTFSEDGELKYNTSQIYKTKSRGRAYWFLEFLNENFGMTRGVTEIWKYVKEKTKSKSKKSAEDNCKHIKSSILKNANDRETVEKILVSNRYQNNEAGYKLQNPT